MTMTMEPPFLGTGLFPDSTGKGLVDARKGDFHFRVQNGRLVLNDATGENSVRLPRVTPQFREIHCALVLDLGNSRTAGLVLDDFDCPQDHMVTFHIVPLQLTDYFDNSEDASIVSDSVLVAESRSKPVSCLCVGKTAAKLEKLARNDPDSFHQAQFAFAAPKLFFWSQERIDMSDPLVVVERSGKEAVNLVDPADDVKKRLVKRCDLLGEMVVELIEQAETKINRWAESTDESNVREGWRRITKVALTYPACWTDAERDRYVATIQKTVDDVWVARHGLKGLEIIPSVDEATAVLLAYATIRTERTDVFQWVQTVGGLSSDRRKSPGLTSVEATFAVLDIGGGTTDIAVETLVIGPSGMGNVATITEDGGVCIAGNIFLRNVLEQVFFPSLFSVLDERGEGVGSKIKAALKRNNNLKKKYCKKHFYDLALQLVLLDKNAMRSGHSTKKSDGKSDKLTQEFIYPLIEDLSKEFPSEWKGVGTSDDISKALASRLNNDTLKEALRDRVSG